MTIRMEVLGDMSVDELRQHVQSILDSARASDHIRTRLATRGVDADGIGELQALLDEFADTAIAYDRFDAGRGDAAQQFDLALDAFRRGRFRDHVELADAAFLDQAGPRRRLSLDDGIGAVNAPYSTWSTQASDFYDALQSEPDLQAALANLNVTPEELAAGADEVARIADLYRERNDFNSDRQQARRDRDALRTTVETELRRFQKIAKVALRDTPEYLERLGFVVESD